MEFEKNAPATAEEIALANAPKITVQPLSNNITPGLLNTNRSHANEATFVFEAETTETQVNDGTEKPTHTVAIVIAGACALCFAAGLAAALFLR